MPPADGQGPWHAAARAGHASVLRAMVDVLREMPPETLAAVFGRIGALGLGAVLAEAAGAMDSKQLTPLHLACIRGHADVVSELMAIGANPFTMDSVGRTPLHYAASWGRAGA